MSIGYASIYLENEKCVGCTRCMQRCPTEAIRIRDGKATILRERCVDCGECIRVCPRHAMKARVDTLSEALGKYKYTIALPAQALYGQFPGVRTRAPILEGLLRIGFDSVFEVAAAAEVMSAVTHYELNYGSSPTRSSRPTARSYCASCASGSRRCCRICSTTAPRWRSRRAGASGSP